MANALDIQEIDILQHKQFGGAAAVFLAAVELDDVVLSVAHQYASSVPRAQHSWHMPLRPPFGWGLTRSEAVKNVLSEF
ncbi:hypothetical protein [Peribacillus sp. SCS-155]|uniref:hypothetical protein n=1 Tax=Peribacillus sedimenti TaxID=3115297 RepID=UPI0039060F67